MTGYIHICKNCDGDGYFWVSALGFVVRIPQGMSFLEYKGDKPSVVRCVMCEGRGYWEP